MYTIQSDRPIMAKTVHCTVSLIDQLLLSLYTVQSYRAIIVAYFVHCTV